MRSNGKGQGLTTAASIWFTAAFGVLCGLAAWMLVPGALFLLLAGGSIEKWCQKALGIVEKADLSGSR
jgi:putative Mg2+ transporter-C (MgtC) family protein